MGISSNQLEEIAFASLRNVFECAACMVRFGGANSAGFEGIVSNQSTGTIIMEEGQSTIEAGTLYMRLSNFPGVNADKTVEITDENGTWVTRRVINSQKRGRSIMALDLQGEWGKRTP